MSQCAKNVELLPNPQDDGVLTFFVMNKNIFPILSILQ